MPSTIFVVRALPANDFGLRVFAALHQIFVELRDLRRRRELVVREFRAIELRHQAGCRIFVDDRLAVVADVEALKFLAWSPVSCVRFHEAPSLRVERGLVVTSRREQRDESAGNGLQIVAKPVWPIEIDLRRFAARQIIEINDRDSRGHETRVGRKRRRHVEIRSCRTPTENLRGGCADR